MDVPDADKKDVRADLSRDISGSGSAEIKKDDSLQEELEFEQDEDE